MLLSEITIKCNFAAMYTRNIDTMHWDIHTSKSLHSFKEEEHT